MTEHNPVEMWRKSLSPADLDVHRGALFDSLRAAGKVSEKEVAGLSGGEKLTPNTACGQVHSGVNPSGDKCCKLELKHKRLPRVFRPGAMWGVSTGCVKIVFHFSKYCL